jgi:hypothetical protein
MQWNQLTCAYGSAGIVPEIIESLKLCDPDEVAEAIGGLYATIYHQGDVYDSTAAAIPLLAQVLRDECCICRARVAVLIGNIITATHAEDQQDEVAKQIDRAVDSVFDQLTALINDRNPDLRRVIPFVLSEYIRLNHNQAVSACVFMEAFFDAAVVEEDAISRACFICAGISIGNINDSSTLERAITSSRDSHVLTAVVTVAGMRGFDVGEHLATVVDAYRNEAETKGFFDRYSFQSMDRESLFPWFQDSVLDAIVDLCLKKEYRNTKEALRIFSLEASRSNRIRCERLDRILRVYLNGESIFSLQKPLAFHLVLNHVLENEDIWMPFHGVQGKVQKTLGVADSENGRKAMRDFLTSAHLQN